MVFQHWNPTQEQLHHLVRHCKLVPQLLQRQIELEIVHLVQLPQAKVQELVQAFKANQGVDDTSLQGWLDARGWTLRDLELEAQRSSCLRLFGEQRFGAGLEDLFVQRKNQLDTAVYSLLRVRDRGLAQELWIQISEGETTFAEAASRYSDGPEATTKGVIGPLSLGAIQPELAERLRGLQPGEVRAPEAMGQWYVLLRLELLTAAKLDEPTRQRLINEELQGFLQERCQQILNGSSPDPLDYHGKDEPS